MAENKEIQSQVEVDVSGQIIVVILHGGLREFVYGQGVFRELREVFVGYQLVLLTTSELHDFAQNLGYFDHVWIDPMYDWVQVKKCWDFRKKFLSMNVKFVIDLQHSDRTQWYFRLIGRKKCDWSGMISWCTYPLIPEMKITDDGEYLGFHILDFHAQQLQACGLEIDRGDIRPNLSWIDADIGAINLDEKFALISPAPPSDNKHLGWNIDNFIDLAEELESQNIRTILIGDKKDLKYAKKILRLCVNTKPLNLMGILSYEQVSKLAQNALFSIGNDTGYIYLCSYSGSPAVFLYSQETGLRHWASDRKQVRIIQNEDVEEISYPMVLSVIDSLFNINDEAEIYSTDDEGED